MDIIIRKAHISDLEEIQHIYSYARQFMKQTGNPDQWKDSYPPLNTILADIENGNEYVIEQGGRICAVFAFLLGEDPTYAYIENGAWLSERPYGTIHRIASDGTLKYTVKIATEYAEKTINNLRIDTYKDNKIMQHVLENLGFKKCGIIYVEDGDPRLAYQRIR